MDVIWHDNYTCFHLLINQYFYSWQSLQWDISRPSEQMIHNVIHICSTKVQLEVNVICPPATPLPPPPVWTSPSPGPQDTLSPWTPLTITSIQLSLRITIQFQRDCNGDRIGQVLLTGVMYRMLAILDDFNRSEWANTILYRLSRCKQTTNYEITMANQSGRLWFWQTSHTNSAVVRETKRQDDIPINEAKAINANSPWTTRPRGPRRSPRSQWNSLLNIMLEPLLRDELSLRVITAVWTVWNWVCFTTK